jgi:two-component system alkaline phosphatase synthesis response regulator PhoP
MNTLIFSVEDDNDISYIINKALTNAGFEVKSFSNGEDLLTALASAKPSLIILDLMLPTMSGFEILQLIRAKKEYDDVEIIILSAKSSEIDRIEGLDMGADDYIVKPFSVLELISRVNTRLRRHKGLTVITNKDITIDVNKHLCLRNNQEPIDLTPKEFDIILYLFENAGIVVSREDLINKIWGTNATYETRTIDMHIRSIRQKLNDLDNEIIQTVHGVGYRVSL